MATHSSQRASVAERRGVDPNISGSWENVLLEGPADAVARALERSGDDVKVQRDVANAVLRGQLPQPAGDWVILVQLHGHPWLFAAGTLGGNLDGKWVASLAKRAGTRAIHLGHEKVSGTSYLTVYDRGGRTALAYSSDGHDVTFRGTLRPRSWLKQFDPIDDFAPQDAIVRELDAFVPEFRAGTDWPRMSRGPKGTIAIETGQPDVLCPANVATALLVDFGFGPGGTAARASVMLGKACFDDDVEAPTPRSPPSRSATSTTLTSTPRERTSSSSSSTTDLTPTAVNAGWARTSRKPYCSPWTEPARVAPGPRRMC